MLQLVRWGGTIADGRPDVREVAEDYYDSEDADTFSSTIWGERDLHVGCYDDTRDIHQASDTTVGRMAAMEPDLGPDTSILDIGAGYDGAMRHVTGQTGGRATCLNISEVQNDTNRHRNRRLGFADTIKVVHGVFEDSPEPAARHDVVWS